MKFSSIKEAGAKKARWCGLFKMCGGVVSNLSSLSAIQKLLFDVAKTNLNLKDVRDLNVGIHISIVIYPLYCKPKET